MAVHSHWSRGEPVAAFSHFNPTKKEILQNMRKTENSLRCKQIEHFNENLKFYLSSLKYELSRQAGRVEQAASSIQHLSDQIRSQSTEMF